MPATLTYPGVYIEEIPSGVRTITGVATSITAFIGRAKRGSVNEPVVINNYGDFERKFGGLWLESTMSYAVRDFFLNGGGQAIIVRLYKKNDDNEGYATATHDTNLTLKAANQGTWGNDLALKVDYDGLDATGDEVAKRYGLDGTDSDFFNLTIEVQDKDGNAIQREQIRNVTFKDSSRRIDRVLKQVSSLVRFDGDIPDPPPARPTEGDASFSGGHDGASPAEAEYNGSRNDKTGLYALENADLFNLLCIPPATRDGTTASGVFQEALPYCKERRAMLIVDPPATWNSKEEAKKLSALGLSGPDARNAAVYFPRVIQADPLREGQLDTFVPCGIVAGVMARTDVERGVWKAPAGIDAALNGVQGLAINLTDDENGELNPLGVNCLRSFPVIGRVVWGARTMRGADQLADEWKYIPVRRLALYMEESLYRGLKWVVFEPNDEPLWSQIRLNVGAFMHNLFRQGAFQGTSPRDAYFVKCDKETTIQTDINLGIVNIHVGFAPLKPAEFVVLKLQQMAGQIQV